MRNLGFAALQPLHGVLGGASEGSEGELRGGGRLELVDKIFKEIGDDEVVVLVVQNPRKETQLNAGQKSGKEIEERGIDERALSQRCDHRIDDVVIEGWKAFDASFGKELLV